MSEPAPENETRVEPTPALVKCLYAVLVLAAIALFSLPIVGLFQREWEDGVFWGAAAVHDGASRTNELEVAYRLKHESAERVKADKKRLNKYRTLSE